MTISTPIISSFSPDTNVVGDGITRSNQLTLIGTAAPNTTITLFDGTTVLGTASVNSSGNWSFFTSSILSDGTHDFTAKDSDGVSTSPASSALSVMVDTHAPSQPTIASWSPDSVNNVDYGVTNSNFVTLHGTAESNCTVTVFNGGTNIGSITADSSGVWNFTTGTLSNGIQAFQVSATDAAGNSSGLTYFPTHVIVDTSTPTTPVLVGGSQIGVMMEGAESSWIGYPGTTDLDYLKSHGVDLVRLPISWELMQNTLNGPLNATYLNGLTTFLSNAAQRGMQVIVELHNHAEYDPTWQQDKAAHGGLFSSAWQIGQPIGSAAVPISSFANFWSQLSTALSGHAGLAGYDLMNEPAYISNTTWQTAAQNAVDAIRTIDTQTAIYVEGSSWSVASTWQLPWYSGSLHVTDPTNNLIYEAHQYFDPDSTGLYYQPFNPQTDYTNIGVDLLQPWLNWLQANNAKGFLGEFGVPVTDARWLPILNAVLDDLQINGIAATYCNYTYKQWAQISIAPENNQGAAAMELIFQHSAPSIAGFVPNNGTGTNGTTTANILTLTGTGASFCSVKVYDNGTLIGTTTSNVSGAWSLTTATLANGTHNFTATNIDAAGTTSENSFTLAVNVAANGLSSPSIVSFSPDSNVVGDGITNANVLTLTGTAVAGATVQVFDGVTQIGTATANGSGAWSFTTGTLADGSHAFTSKVLDTAGNLSAASAALSVTVDTVAPSAPVTVAFSPDSNVVGDGITNANVLTLTGTAVAGATVRVFDGVTQIGTATANGSGAWSFTTGTLADGSHAFTSKVADTAGNLSAASAALSVTVDTVAPSAPVTVAFSPDSNVVGDGITNANVLTLTGTAVAGATVRVFDGVTQIGTATANGSGAWSFTTGTLADGSHAFTSKVADTAGNLSAASAALSVTVDTVAPSAPVTVAFSPDSNVVGDGITNANVLTLTGTAVAGATVRVFDGVTQIGTATANGSGAWSFTTGTLADGSHAFTSKVADTAGNLSAASAALSVTVDTVAPSAPVTVAFSPDSNVVGDGITNANVLTLTGTAVAGATVRVFDGVTQIGTATANGSGAWSFTTGTLADGSHAFTSKVADTAGNLSAASAALSVTVDTVAPSAPVTVAFSPDSNVVGDGITNANVLTLTGTAVAGATVRVFDGVTQIGTATANGSGAWSFTTGTLADGSHAFTSKVLDTAGNLSAASAALSVTVDTVAPSAPVTVAFSPDSNVVGDGITNANVLTLTGTAVAGATVRVFDGVTQIGTATANGSGAWSFTTGTLADGSHAFTSKVADTAGNLSAASAALSVTVDTVAPSAPVTVAFSPDSNVVGDGITNANVLTLTGTAVAGATVRVFDGVTQIGTATANGSGAWSFTTGTLADGSHAFTSKVADTAGNLSAASAALSVTVDTVAPSAPVTVAFSPDSNVVGDGITNANVLTLTGTAVAGATVRVFDGVTQIGTATANGSGAWSFTTGTLADGSHAFTSKVADTAGNLSAASAALSVTVDTVAPSAPSIISDAPSTGNTTPLLGGAETNNTISLLGTAEANSTIRVYEGATLLGNITADAQGQWTFITGQLSAGAHEFTATATDIAGNTSALSLALDPIIDPPQQTPNLVANTVSLGSTTVQAGTRTTLSYHIENNGTALAGASVSKVYLSSDNVITSSDTLLGSTHDGSLQNGHFFLDSVNVTLSSQLKPGTYWIGVIADANGQVTESSEGDNTSNPIQITVTAPPSHSWHRTDFNGDNDADILWQNDNGTAGVWLMNGANVSSMGPALLNPGAAWHVQGAADFNSDGLADILWQNVDGTPGVWLMNGTSVSLMGDGLQNPGTSWHVKAAGDFNGDGMADILWQNDNGTVGVWLMDGTNVVSMGPWLQNPGTSWHAKSAGDFNGDGMDDILWQNDNGMAGVWLMNGTNVLSMGPGLPNLGASWHVMAAGDFDGDGMADILWQNVDGTPMVWLMNGTNIVSMGAALPNPGSSWHALGAQDVDGDGRADILWQNADGTPAAWLMNGTSVSFMGQLLANPGTSWHVVGGSASDSALTLTQVMEINPVSEDLPTQVHMMKTLPSSDDIPTPVHMSDPGAASESVPAPTPMFDPGSITESVSPVRMSDPGPASNDVPTPVHMSDPGATSESVPAPTPMFDPGPTTESVSPVQMSDPGPASNDVPTPVHMSDPGATSESVPAPTPMFDPGPTTESVSPVQMSDPGPTSNDVPTPVHMSDPGAASESVPAPTPMFDPGPTTESVSPVQMSDPGPTSNDVPTPVHMSDPGAVSESVPAPTPMFDPGPITESVSPVQMSDPGPASNDVPTPVHMSDPGATSESVPAPTPMFDPGPTTESVSPVQMSDPGPASDDIPTPVRMLDPGPTQPAAPVQLFDPATSSALIPRQVMQTSDSFVFKTDFGNGIVIHSGAPLPAAVDSDNRDLDELASVLASATQTSGDLFATDASHSVISKGIHMPASAGADFHFA